MPNVIGNVRFIVAAIALWLCFVSSVSAQGTDEQTAACSGDAFTLCRGDIPDVAKITACMRAHEAQLSPRCRAQFHATTATPPRKASEKQATTVQPRRSPADISKHPAEARAPKNARESADFRKRSRPAPKSVETLATRKAVMGEAPPAPSAPERMPGLAAYRASIVSSCSKGLIDPYTCRSTLGALSLLE